MGLIDRTNFNALIDDDGSGTKGSVWNKSAIDSVILTPCDQQFGFVGTWNDIPFSAANYGNMTVAAGNMLTHACVFYSKWMILTVYLSNVSVPSSVTNVSVKVPYGQVISRQSIGAAMIAVPGWEAATVTANINTSVVYVQRSTLGPIAGTVSLYFTIIISV